MRECERGDSALWGAQAASLFISAACRDACYSIARCAARIVAGKLPATTGWQPVLPRINSLGAGAKRARAGIPPRSFVVFPRAVLH